MRVYTFTLPKFVSGFVRKCMVVFKKEKTPKVSKASTKKKKKRHEKMPR